MYPTESQKYDLAATLETCRHLYNDSLGERSADWALGFYEQKRLLVFRKQENRFYRQVNAQVRQDVVLRLEKAYRSFFNKLSGYPRFKRREQYNSFTYPQYGQFKLKHGRLFLSCIGSIKIKMHRIPVGTLKRCTIIRDVDQWFCCVNADDAIEKKAGQFDKSKPVGIDVGLLNWVTLSNGKKIQNTIDFEA